MASPQGLTFEEEVYLAFKDIFIGQRAEYRKAKAVLRIVNKYQSHTPVSSLLRTTNRQAVCESLCRLLKARVFQYENIATHWFGQNPSIVAQESGAVVSDVPLTFGLLEASSAASLIGTDMIKGGSSEVEAAQTGTVFETALSTSQVKTSQTSGLS